MCIVSAGIAKVTLGVGAIHSALRESFSQPGCLVLRWRQSQESFVDNYQGVRTGGAMEVNAGAYVINLLRRPERKARMQALCAPLVTQGLPVEVRMPVSVRSRLPCVLGGGWKRRSAARLVSPPGVPGGCSFSRRRTH